MLTIVVYSKSRIASRSTSQGRHAKSSELQIECNSNIAGATPVTTGAQKAFAKEIGMLYFLVKDLGLSLIEAS